MEMRLSAPLARALARIPQRQRAALLLAEVNDLTGMELAETLGVSHVAARALLTRARESLRQALADEKRQEKEREDALDAAYAARTRGADAARSDDDAGARR
jgi:DNA-directed RNA polymerase specialized sigma24 family protein